MHNTLKEICEILKQIENTIKNSTNNHKIRLDPFDHWNSPILDGNELALIAMDLRHRLEDLDLNEFNEKQFSNFSEVPKKLKHLLEIAPRLSGGNANEVIPVYLGYMQWLDLALAPLFRWDNISNDKLPNKLRKKLSNISSQIDVLIPERDKVVTNIELINQAVEAAENLPVDLHNLEETSERINLLLKDTIVKEDKLKENFTSSNKIIQDLERKKDQANKLVEHCEDAYRITTSKGLAGAFDQRASSLTRSVWGWVILLTFALGIGAWIGYSRFDKLTELIKDQNAGIGEVFMSFFLSVLSVGGSIWFAWIATKQIGYRFRLAEDYAYKSSLAKAYEGYRREAAKIDPKLEERLFHSVLTRLEEIPLRLMTNESHGSPVHEIMNSPQLEKALNQINEVKEHVEKLGKRISSLIKDKKYIGESEV